MNEPVKIDPEFQNLVPPLTPDEFHQLEENCKKDGILDTLKVWHGILIDGHNRYRIAKEWDMPYATEEMLFRNRDEAKVWIANNQLGRRNINDLTKIELARIAKPEIVKEAEKRMKSGKADPMAKSPEGYHNNTTRHKLAKAAGMGEKKFHQGEVILDSGNQEIIDAVRSGEISINRGYNLILDEQTPRPKTVKQEKAEQLQAAKERHEEYRDKKVISLEDAKQDKEDQKTIAKEIYDDLLTITTRAHWIAALHSSSDFDSLSNVIPPDKVEGMLSRIDTMITVLMKVKEVLNGRIK